MCQANWAQLSQRPPVCWSPSAFSVAVWFLGLVAFTGVFKSMPSATAEEPYQVFLEKLRSEQLYDLALTYLDDLQKIPKLAPDLASNYLLERALLLQESATLLAVRSPMRNARLDDAKRAFEEFLEKHKEHDRRSEARLGLGNLLLSRADEARGDIDPKLASPEALTFYTEAASLFESAQKELEEMLTQMKGARVDATDEDKKAQRERFRDDYRRAELLAAFANERKGRSHAWGSNEWKTELTKAEKLYTELYEHEKGRVEIRNYALFYRSGIRRDLGKIEDSIDGYNRIVSEEGIDELRPLQFKALTEILNLWGSKEQKKYAAAVDLANRWEKQIRPDEKATQDVIDFLIAAGRVKIDFAAELQAKDPNDRGIVKLRKETRDSLQRLVRINGSHQADARALLVRLGVSNERSAEPTELPVVKNFAEALKEANDRFELLDADAIEQTALQEKFDAAADDANRTELGDQLTKLNGRLERLRDQTSQLLSAALRMFPVGGELSELTNARHRLAYIELKRENYWDAIAIGEFLARTNAGSEAGLSYATVALSAYGSLLNESNADGQKQLMIQFEPFAQFMLDTWPQAAETQAAISTLVGLAMNVRDFAKAQAYLEQLPAGTGKSDKLRREIGMMLANQYFIEREQVPPGTKPPAELIAKRDSALEQFNLAIQNIGPDEIDARWIESINSMIRLQLAAGKIEEAAKWTRNAQLSPVTIMKSNPALVADRSLQMDTLRTALQATASLLGTEGNSDAMKQIEQLLAELQAAAGTDAEGQTLLNNNLIWVARDLQDLVEGANSTAEKQKLAEGLVLLCKQIAAGTDDFNKKMWAGATLSKLGESLQDSAKQASLSLQREAITVLKDILEREQNKQGYITIANGELVVRIRLAKALRQASEYQAAIDQLTKILGINASMLDMQIEAAETFQAWGDSGSPEKYRSAIYGAVPGGPSGNVVWGWAKLAKALERRSQFAEQFFQSRYQLAVCLYRAALAQTDASVKTKELQRTEREITSTALLYPALGGEESGQRFDALMKKVQADLGKPATGIKK